MININILLYFIFVSISNMNKLDKNKMIERPKVEPLGDLKIAEARGKK